jgi:hypothetical protein
MSRLFIAANGDYGSPFTITSRDTTYSALSAFCRFKLSSTAPGAGSVLVGKGFDSVFNSTEWYLFINNVSAGVDAVQFQIYDGTGWGASANVPNLFDGLWHSAAGVYINGTYQVFFDGRIVATAGGQHAPTKNNAWLAVAAVVVNNSSVQNYFDGKLQDVAIWNTNLSPRDIFRLHSGERPKDVRLANLMQYWTFEGGAPSNNEQSACGGSPLLFTDTGGAGYPYLTYDNPPLITQEQEAPWTQLKGYAVGGTTFNQSVLASNTPTASMIRQTAKSLLSANTPPASVFRQTSKTIQAVDTPVASLAEARVKLQSVLATNTPPASVTRQTSKTLTSSDTPVSSIIKQATKTLQATDTPVASVTKQTTEPLQATNTPAASLSETKVKLQSVQATNTPVASMIRQTAKSLLAQTSPVSNIVRQIAKFLRSSTTPSASVGKGRTQSLQATNTPVADLSATTGGVTNVSLQATNTPVASVSAIFRARVLVARAVGAVALIWNLITKTEQVTDADGSIDEVDE